MKIPLTLLDNLSVDYFERWKRQFVNVKSVKRDSLEGLWRRTQEYCNKENSGWMTDNDKRRKIIHFKDRYDFLVDRDHCRFVLAAPYLWIHLLNPKQEIELYEIKLRNALERGGWHNCENEYFRGDLRLKYDILDRHEEDTKANRLFPDNYKILEITLYSTATYISDDDKRHPWGVLNSGIRQPDKRGNPTYVDDLRVIKKHLPAQVELGCGPSIEARIPPLYELHKHYYIHDPTTRKFILQPENDNLINDILENPEDFFLNKATVAYKEALRTELTPFYLLLKKLHLGSSVVGPIITNNFDGLCARMDLEEDYVRRFDDQHIVPNVEFHNHAKSLIVFGSHADRRKIQAAARWKGLKVIYVDPEGYMENGNFKPYYLESPQTGDIVVKMTAEKFTSKWKDLSL